MHLTGFVILWGRTSDTDPPKLHVYRSSTDPASWKKEMSVPGFCEHDNIKLLPTVIDRQEYLLIACLYCKKIRLWNIVNSKTTTAFCNPDYFPGYMCQGDSGQIYAVHSVKGYIPILQLDCPGPEFNLCKTIQTRMEALYAICYMQKHRLIAVSDNTPGIVRAICCQRKTVVWELTGKVEDIDCRPHGMVYSPPHDALLVADGANCRILVLNPKDGSVRQVVPLDNNIGVVSELSLCNTQVVIRHTQSSKVFISYFAIE